jgi:hypothetical protein
VDAIILELASALRPNAKIVRSQQYSANHLSGEVRENQYMLSVNYETLH